MATNREEIIEDFQEQMRKTGGGAGEWLVGTAKDPRSPFFRNHLVADLDDELIYREAFTTTAAQAVRDHFVNDCGLELDLTDAPEPGKIVFICKRGNAKSPRPATAAAHCPPPADHAIFRKHAA